MRQESRFIINARSGVGASGLMQLMPATAQMVAKKIGLGRLSRAQMNDIDTNILLGTNYLSMVYNQFDGSAVLATAGYNAGPGRPRQWQKSLNRPVEGAIFAETIPFSETRDYVKNVLSNTTYYGALFEGQPQSLKARLGVILPAP
jgi:soluble lytic murein transglycosylase